MLVSEMVGGAAPTGGGGREVTTTAVAAFVATAVSTAGGAVVAVVEAGVFAAGSTAVAASVLMMGVVGAVTTAFGVGVALGTDRVSVGGAAVGMGVIVGGGDWVRVATMGIVTMVTTEAGAGGTGAGSGGVVQDTTLNSPIIIAKNARDLPTCPPLIAMCRCCRERRYGRYLSA